MISTTIAHFVQMETTTSVFAVIVWEKGAFTGLALEKLLCDFTNDRITLHWICRHIGWWEDGFYLLGPRANNRPQPHKPI